MQEKTYLHILLESEDWIKFVKSMEMKMIKRSEIN